MKETKLSQKFTRITMVKFYPEFLTKNFTPEVYNWCLKILSITELFVNYRAEITELFDKKIRLKVGSFKVLDGFSLRKTFEV